MLPASGSETASAKTLAIAASTALPPASSIRCAIAALCGSGIAMAALAVGFDAAKRFSTTVDSGLSAQAATSVNRMRVVVMRKSFTNSPFFVSFVDTR